MKLWTRPPQESVIFQSSWGKTSGETLIVPFSPRRSKYQKLLRPIGKSLIVIAFAGLLLSMAPLMAAEIKQRGYQVAQWFGWKPKVIQESKFGRLLEQKPAPPPEQRFQLVIPKLNINSAVIPNVDPANPEEYLEALKQGIAHAKGSGLPGETSHNQTIYLFAHSATAPLDISRYNALFYLLGDLETNDEIIVWFWGEKFIYQVVNEEIIEADDTHYFTPQTEEERLILQTCWPPGTTLKQLIIMAKPK